LPLPYYKNPSWGFVKQVSACLFHITLGISHEYGSNRFLRNVGNEVPDCKTSHLRTELSLLWELEISEILLPLADKCKIVTRVFSFIRQRWYLNHRTEISAEWETLDLCLARMLARHTPSRDKAN
jgi:hypothetical protein